MNRTVSALSFSMVALAAIAASVATPAYAEGPIESEPPFVSSRTRAEVIAELQEFQRAGANPWADTHDQLQAFRSTRTRQEVVAEYLGERQMVAAMNGEDSGSSYLYAHAPSTVVPAPVMASAPEHAE